MPKLLNKLFSFFIIAFVIAGVVNAGTTAPTTTYIQTPSTPDGKNDWYVSPVQFDLQATDLESGVKSINYRIDGGSWQSVEFSDTLNLAPNPSFEIAGATSSGLTDWEATLVDGDTSYSQDGTNYAPNYSVSSARIVTTTPTPGLWHGINNKASFAVAYGYENMTASAWIKTTNVAESAYFKVYSIADDGLGGEVITLLTQSSALSGTNDWTFVSVGFTALPEATTGIYLDIGLQGAGTMWADAVTINSSLQIAETTVIVGSDSESHTFEFYSVDQVGNAEHSSCTDPKANCVEFKIDMTPPGNWYDSGAFRGFFGSDHELWVYTSVEDATSGLSEFTDKYQYHTEQEEGFGHYEDLLKCNSAWLLNNWYLLISPPFESGAKEAFLLTPKTDFCNNNWKICKTVRFFAEDMAGNSATKDFCINGPWVRTTGEGIVRSNQNIDMLSEPPDSNTDGLIEVGSNIVNFFTSSKNWRITNSPTPQIHSYSDFWNAVTEPKTQITEDLVATDGIYYVSGDFTISNQSVPNGYDNNTFDQIVFIDGNLTIIKDIDIDNTSTALFVVSGNVNIEKSVDHVDVAIIADGDIDTASDVAEGESNNPIDFFGVFRANSFLLKRTLQGTNNEDTPSETFNFEPKYLIQLKKYFGNNTVQWKNVE